MSQIPCVFGMFLFYFECFFLAIEDNGWAMVSLRNRPLGHSENTKPSLQGRNFQRKVPPQ